MTYTIEATKIRVGTLRGLVMRAPGITATRDFYLDQWGLHLAYEGDGITYLRGTGAGTLASIPPSTRLRGAGAGDLVPMFLNIRL